MYCTNMLELAPPGPSEPLTPREQRAADALCMLQELAEIGMDMARVCGRRMHAQEQMDEVAPAASPPCKPPSFPSPSTASPARSA